MSRAFKLTQTNSRPFKGLDGQIIFSNGTEDSYKLMVVSVDGLGFPTLTPQTQVAPFQQGSSLIRTLFSERQITFECAISVAGNSPSAVAEIETIKRALGNVLSPVGMGFLPDTSNVDSNYSTWTAQLAYASDGVTYDRFIDVVPMVVDLPNKFYKDGFQHVRIVLFCPDPFWYGSLNTQIFSSIAAGASGNWFSVCWSSKLGIFCSVSYSGSNRIQTSEDGITWVIQTPPSTDQWYSICWSDELEMFCATSVGGTYQVMTSLDGVNWNGHTVSEANTWYSVCWASDISRFCAVSIDGTHRAMTSVDGTSWVLHTVAEANQWVSVCWASELSLFCAVSYDGTNRIMTSPDGSTWAAHTAPEANQWTWVCWSPQLSLFCAVANTGTYRVMTSPDGSSWSGQIAAEPNEYLSVCWSPSLSIFCAISDDGTDRVMTSPDGIVWSARITNSLEPWHALCWSVDLGMFCVVGYGTGQYPMISYDGVNWIDPTSDDFYAEISNNGDVPTPFSMSFRIAGGETGKVVSIGDNFLWSGVGTPPSDRNLVIGTDGLVTGVITIDTTFGSKSIKQFGKSILYKLGSGSTFFNLYIDSNTANRVYYRNTGTPTTSPQITWRNRYLTV